MRAMTLTDSERVLLPAMAAGFTTRQLAELRGRSPATVTRQVAMLEAKLGASNRTEAVMNAIRRGLLVVPGVNV